MRRWLIALALVFLSYASNAAAPATPSYEVEVLVFEVRLAELEGGELWTRLERPAQSGETAKPANPKEMTPTEDFAAIAEALRADGRYRVMLHKRWVQAAEPKSNGSAVPLATWDREMEGTLLFYLSRFLHVELNLVFQPQTTAIGGEAAPSYVINEQRRIKSNDLNYFDHPKFGALVKVTPVSG